MPKYRILWDFLPLPRKHHTPRPPPAQIRPKYRINGDPYGTLPISSEEACLDQPSTQAGGASQACGKVPSSTPKCPARILT